MIIKTENDMRTKIVTPILQKAGWLVIPIENSINKGLTDIIAIAPDGMSHYIELKIGWVRKDTNDIWVKYQSGQRAVQRRIQRQRAPVFVFAWVEDKLLILSPREYWTRENTRLDNWNNRVIYFNSLFIDI